MTKKERCEAVLSGQSLSGPPPVVPIYDLGYVAKLSGGCSRDFITQGRDERIKYIEHALLRHDIDGNFVHIGTNNEFSEKHDLLDIKDSMHYYRHKETGEFFSMDEAGNKFGFDGEPVHMMVSTFDSHIKRKEDIARVLSPPLTMDNVKKNGRYSPLEHLAKEYPDFHYSSQIASPVIHVIQSCGYEAAMCMLLDEPDLMHEAVEYAYASECSRIELCKEFGARSIWLTSSFTGTDTISPACFREFAAPYERRLTEKAHELGLYVIYWFLGDMRGIMDDIGALPIDAILPEQPRKGYPVDIAALRNVMGRNRCVMSYTYETHFISADKQAINTTYEEQYELCGRSGAFAASTTIMPPDADPCAMDMYCEIVKP